MNYGTVVLITYINTVDKFECFLYFLTISQFFSSLSFEGNPHFSLKNISRKYPETQKGKLGLN